jgi:hypothetical protein
MRIPESDVGRLTLAALVALTLFAGMVRAEETPAVSAAPIPPSLYVVDVSNTLSAYGRDGSLLQKVTLDPDKATLNGGIAVGEGHVFVTYYRPDGKDLVAGVVAFNAVTLHPTMLHQGAFHAPAELGDAGLFRAITFDPGKQQYHLASDKLGPLVFDRFGKFVSRLPGGPTAASALTFDRAHHALWLVDGSHRLVVYRGESDAPTSPTDAAAAGVRPKRGFAPVAAAVCGSDDSAVLAVVYASTGRGAAGAGQAYDPAGKPLGKGFAGKIANPHAIACTADGTVYVAADNGLRGFTLQGEPVPLGADLAALTGPVKGVYAVE